MRFGLDLLLLVLLLFLLHHSGGCSVPGPLGAEQAGMAVRDDA